MSAKHARIRPGPARPSEHAGKISEYVTEAWYGHHGSGNLEVPLSVVAALSLVSPPFDQRHEVAGELISADVDVFCQCIRVLWRQFMVARPDLINRVWPLVQVWEGENYPMTVERRRAAKHAGTAALRNDLFSLTSTEGRWDVDLLGTVLTVLRPKSAIQGRGQYYTPSPVTEVMSRLLLADLYADLIGMLQPDEKPAERLAINDPCCGSGGMFRGMAVALRARGEDPAAAYWEGNDVDELAVACCAVNVVLWGLGTNVLLGVGDTIKDDWRERAIGERAETISLVRDLRMLAILRDLDGSLDRLSQRHTEQPVDDPGRPDPEPTGQPAAEPVSPAPTNPEPASEPTPAEPDPVRRVKVRAHHPAPEIDLDTADAGALVGEFWELVDVVTAQEK